MQFEKKNFFLKKKFLRKIEQLEFFRFSTACFYLLSSQSGGVKCTKSPGKTLSVCIHKNTSFSDTIAKDSKSGECISPSLLELP